MSRTMKYNIFLLICVILCVSSRLTAQEAETWSLQKCIDYALAHNTSLKQEQLTYNIKKLSILEKKWAFAPKVVANTSFSASSGRVLDQTTYEFIGNSRIGAGTYSIIGTFTIFNGLRNLYELDYSKLDTWATHYRIATQKLELCQRIVESYFQIRCNEDAWESSKCIRDIAKKQLEIITQQVKNGRAIESEELSAKAQLYDAESDVVTAEGNLKISQNSLCYLLGIEPPIPFIVEKMDTMAAPSLNDLYDVLEKLPEYRSAEMAVKMAERAHQIARSYYFPSISLSFGYGSSFSTARQLIIETGDSAINYIPYPFVNQLKDNASLYLTLNMSIPIFNQYSTTIQNQKSVLALENSRNSLMSTKQVLSQQINQIEIECRSLYQQKEMAKQEFIFAESNEIILREKFNLGIIDYNTWNISLVNLAKAKYRYIEAQYSYFVKVHFAHLLLKYSNN